MGERIIYVEDAAKDRNLGCGLLESDGHEVKAFESTEQAFVWFSENSKWPTVALIDYFLPAANGLVCGVSLRARRPDLPLVMLTNETDSATAASALGNGFSDFLRKPLTLERFRTTLRKVAPTIAASPAAASGDSGGEAEIVGSSDAIRAVLVKAKKFALTREPVLILGESGVGKELVSKVIHNASASRVRLVTVNAAGLTGQLAHDELFGHVPGAFTDARTGREGKIEQANRGTLFLDEIADTPLETQARLLRVLEEKVVERSGGSQQIQVDVKFVFATNRDLAQRVQTGEFREDFMYRINGCPVEVPPLRNRLEDVPALLSHFLAKFWLEEKGEALLPGEWFSPIVLSLAQSCSWPGNIRVLKNKVKAAVVLAASLDEFNALLRIEIETINSLPAPSGIGRSSRGAADSLARNESGEASRIHLGREAGQSASASRFVWGARRYIALRILEREPLEKPGAVKPPELRLAIVTLMLRVMTRAKAGPQQSFAEMVFEYTGSGSNLPRTLHSQLRSLTGCTGAVSAALESPVAKTYLQVSVEQGWSLPPLEKDAARAWAIQTLSEDAPSDSG